MSYFFLHLKRTPHNLTQLATVPRMPPTLPGSHPSASLLWVCLVWTSRIKAAMQFVIFFV